MPNPSQPKISRLTRRVVQVLVENWASAFVVSLLFAAISSVGWNFRLRADMESWSRVLAVNGAEAVSRALCFSAFVIAATRSRNDESKRLSAGAAISLRFVVGAVFLAAVEFGTERTVGESLWITGCLFSLNLAVEVFVVAWVAGAVLVQLGQPGRDDVSKSLSLARRYWASLSLLCALPFFLANLVLIPVTLSKELSPPDELWLTRGFFAIASCCLAVLPVALAREVIDE